MYVAGDIDQHQQAKIVTAAPGTPAVAQDRGDRLHARWNTDPSQHILLAHTTLPTKTSQYTA